jgi:hypothetical protein
VALREWIDGALALLAGAWRWVAGSFRAIGRWLRGGGSDVLPRPPASDGTGGDVPALRIDGINVYRKGNVITFQDADLSIDYDGAPNAYAPPGVGKPLDNLRNAGDGSKWWGIATDEAGKPLIQGPEDPYPGYYISTTALSWPGQDRTRRYVDSTQISYLALPKAFKDLGAKLGDFALVSSRATGRKRGAIWADIGPRAKLGEGSIQLARALGVESGALRKSGIDVTLWAGSGDGRPYPEDVIQARVSQLAGEGVV